MDKLIELFKQHKRETGTSYEYILFRDNDAGLQARCIDYGKEIYIVRQAEILSKKMGFIKRLVDNDKIDRGKIEERISGDVSLYLDNREYYGRYKWLLMLLAIQDEPIEFLISILK